MATPRIAPVVQEECDDDLRRLLKASEGTTGATTLFWVMARNPGLFRRYMAFAGKFLNGKLPAALREAVILRVAGHTGCRYIEHHHIRIGRSVGLSKQEISWSLDTSGLSDNIGATGGVLPKDAAQYALAATDELIKDGRVSDDTWALLAQELDERQLLELLMLVGNYRMLAGFIESMRIGPEDEDI